MSLLLKALRPLPLGVGVILDWLLLQGAVAAGCALEGEEFLQSDPSTAADMVAQLTTRVLELPLSALDSLMLLLQVASVEYFDLSHGRMHAGMSYVPS